MSLDVSLNKKLGIYSELSNEQKAKMHEEYAYYIKYSKSDAMRFDDWYNINGVEELYCSNITHNLGLMAIKAGIYEALWRPHRLKNNYNISENDHIAESEFEEKQTIKANEIIELLEKGLSDLKTRPQYFKQFNSPNGWGLYEHFVPFVEEYLNACKKYPESEIIVSR